MNKYILAVFFFIILFVTPSKANEILKIRDIYFTNLTNQSTTIYLEIENYSDQLEYLLGVELVGYEDIKANVYKTVIDQNIAKIIKIDRLAIPAKSVIKLHPKGIYLVANRNLHELKSKDGASLKFIFSTTKIEIKCNLSKQPKKNYHY